MPKYVKIKMEIRTPENSEGVIEATEMRQFLLDLLTELTEAKAEIDRLVIDTTGRLSHYKPH